MMRVADEAPLRYTKDIVHPWARESALIKAVVNEIGVLARAYRLTMEPCYAQAASEGVDFLLKAQYPNGGWPRSYPHYDISRDRHVTFKDQEMTLVMRLLYEVATDRDVDTFDGEMRVRAQQAFEKGIDYILGSQIVVREMRTVWSQQHDEFTYEPCAARELRIPVLSTVDSANVLAFLMSMERPRGDVIRAVECGIAWYKRTKIEGLRVARTSHDCVVRPDPSAPSIWSRFYRINTNQPVFAGRNGVVRDRLVQIEKDLRVGYAWYGYWGKDVLAQYDVWSRGCGQSVNRE